MKRKSTLATVGVVAGLVGVILWALSVGSVSIPVKSVFRILFGEAGGLPESWILILRRVRLPRVLAAGMIGGILSVGGVSCQGLFRNPLSEPYLLGISSGAALGATLAIVFGGVGIGVFAFAGAMLVTMTVFAAAGRGAFKLPSTLLLTGIAVAFLCQSIIWLIMTLNRDQVERITFWTLGSLSSITWSKAGILAAVTIPATAILLSYGRVLDILSTGYDSAHGLGLRPQRSAAIILGLTALGTAAAVSAAGSIGFVGLMVPHVMRILGGPAHKGLILRAWLGGAALLIVADIAARTVNPPGEIPIGIITALLGAPFLLVLARGKRGDGRLDG